MASTSEGLGRETVCTVQLPRGPEPPALADMPSSSKPASVRLRILVVEDNHDVAESLRMLLEIYGYEVTVAYSGPEGVQAAKAVRPHIVVSDIGLPGMDGFAVATALRRDPTTADAWLIALTGYGQEDRQRSRAAGFDYHLDKPVDPSVLEKTLTSCCR